MSKIIKSSQITGEYRLSDKLALKKQQEKARQKKEKMQQKNEKLKSLKEQILAEARQEAEAIKEKARKEADQIKSAAQEEVQEIKEEARAEGQDKGYQEGLEKGKKAGREEALAEMQQELTTLEQTAKKAEEEIQEELANLPERMVDLAIEISRHIVQTQLKLKPELILPIVKDCLSEVSMKNNEVKVRVNPQLASLISQLENNYQGEFDLEIISDKDLARGDCLVETEFGGRDATLEAKYKLLRQNLNEGTVTDEKS